MVLLGCNVNEHLIIWSSIGNKTRKTLLEGLLANSLKIANDGNEPNFINIRRREVIEITIGTVMCNSNRLACVRGITPL